MKGESILRPGMTSCPLRSQMFRGAWSRPRPDAGNCTWKPSHGEVEFRCNQQERSRCRATSRVLRRGCSLRKSLCTGARRRWRTPSGSYADRITDCAECLRLMAQRKAVLTRETVQETGDRKSTRLNSSHDQISYAVF